MVYVFDIDGTVCKSSNSEYEKATPIQSRIKKVNDLYDEGHSIIFQTARGMGRSDNSAAYAHKAFYEFTKKQLDSWGVKYHSLFLGKPAGDVYVDDKGIRDEDFFTD
jgi:histidinol phosphatase-like enzyme